VRIVERFTVVDKATISYQVTIDDPKVLAGRFISAVADKPATLDGVALGGAFMDTPQQNYELYEYACHEGNRSMEAILGGGRAPRPATPPGPLTR
jgi:hypothetical protein